MGIVLKVSSNIEYWNGGCAFALLDLTPELAGLLRLSVRGYAIGCDRDKRVNGV
jgi:hypothetical protein